MNGIALGTVILALLAGGALGALLTWAWCSRRIRTQDGLRDQLQAVFGDLARDSLQSNNEVFLQLAAERLARQQQAAAEALKEREVAIETLVQPLREALTRLASESLVSGHSGRGVLLMKAFMDEFDVQISSAGGAKVVMAKRCRKQISQAI